MKSALCTVLISAFVLPHAAFAAGPPAPHLDTISCGQFPDQVQILVPSGTYDYVVDVADGPDADFLSIQDALDGSVDDDVIYVCPGHYYEQIRVEHRVDLLSLAGAEDTVIDSAGGGTVATLNAATTLRGFTLTGAAYTSVCYYGGGIKIAGHDGESAPVHVIENNRIVDNEACKVGGIFVGGFSNGTFSNTVTAYIRNNIIAGNTAVTYNAGGISIHKNRVGAAYIRNNVIASNAALSYGAGGVEAIGSGTSTYDFRNNVVYDNAGTGVSSSAALVNSYNDVYGNSSDTVSGVGNIQSDPLFVDEIEYRLSGPSPCVDAGDPASTYQDNDATRNDIGAYGGLSGDW